VPSDVGVAVDNHGGPAADNGVPPQSFPIVATPDFLVTYDTERTEHIISDEQLMQLSRGGSDVSLEICLASVGIGLGFAQNLYAGYIAVQSAGRVGTWDAFGALVCVAAATAAVFSGISHRAVRGEMKRLIHKIKGRKLGRIPASADRSSSARSV